MYIYIYILSFFGCAGLSCCADFSLVVASKGYSMVAVCGLLTAVISLVEHRLWDARASVIVACGLSSCGLWA